MDVTTLAIQKEIALSRASYLPTPEDTSHFEARSTSIADAIDQIDGQLSNLQLQMNALKARRERLQRFSDLIRGHMAPIRRLPVEIFQNIFEHAIPQLYYHILLSGCWDFERQGDIQELCREQRDIRTALSLVCWSWSTIIRNTPGFWSALMLDPNHSQDHSVGPHAFWNVHNGLIDAFVDPHLPEGRSSEFWHIIFDNLDRIRVMDIGYTYTSERSEHPHFWSSIITQRSHFPALRILRVNDGIENSGFQDTRSDIATIHAPKLRWLCLPSYFDYTLPYFTIDSLAFLSVLVLETPPRSHGSLIDALSVCQRLTFFQWDIDISINLPEAPRSSIRRLPTLCFPALKGFALTLHHYLNPSLPPDIMDQCAIPFIDAPMVESIALTLRLNRDLIQGAQRVVINAIELILSGGTPFVSTLKLSRLDPRNELVSTKLFGHFFPVLRQLTFDYAVLTPRFLLSLMPCGPLYDTVSDHRPHLIRVHLATECELVATLVAGHDMTQTPTSTIRLYIGGHLLGRTSRTGESWDEALYFYIYSQESHWLQRLSLEDANDIRKLHELYGHPLHALGQ